MKKVLAVSEILLAGIFWGIVSIFSKKMTSFGFSAFQTVGVRVIISAIIMCGYAGIFKPDLFKIKWKDVWIFACFGVFCASVLYFLYLYTIEIGGASVAVVLMYTSPAFVMIISAIFFKEKITVNKIIAIVFTILGCVFASGILGGVKIPALAIITGLGSGLFFAFYSILGTLVAKRYQSLTITLYAFIFGSLSSILFCDLGGIINNFVANPISVLWGVGIAVVCSISPCVLFMLGLRNLEPSKASIISAIEVVVAFLVGIILFNEDKSIVKILGIVLIISAIVIANITFKKKEEIIPFKKK